VILLWSDVFTSPFMTAVRCLALVGQWPDSDDHISALNVGSLG
jgi:hypothetical protein